MKHATTTTKIKIIFFVLSTGLLILLCYISWDVSFFTLARTIIPTLFYSLSPKVLGGFAIVVILIFLNGFYNLYQKMQRRNLLQNITQAETSSPPALSLEQKTILFLPDGYPNPIIADSENAEVVNYEPAQFKVDPPVKKKKKNHPDKDWKKDQWREAYGIIKPMRRTHTLEQISAVMIDKFPHLPHSVDRLSEILKWGDDNFPD